MAWVKLDDQFYMNPKVLAAGPHAVALHIAGMCWVGGQLTDGAIPRHALPLLTGQAGVPAKTVERLVESGLWDATADGWVIHDWHDWNPPAEKVRADRAAARERMANVRANKQRTFGRSSASPSPSPPVLSEQGRELRSGATPEPNLRALPAYQKPDLTPGCELCDGFGEVFEGNERGPCPRCQEAVGG